MIYIVRQGQKVLYVGSSAEKLRAWQGIEGVVIEKLGVSEEIGGEVESALVNWFKPPMNHVREEVRGLEAVRESRRISQKDLARMLDINQSTLRNWEKKRSGWQMFCQVAKICEILQCDASDLCDGDVESDSVDLE